MSAQENKAIMRRFIEEAWNQNNVAELDEYVAADAAHHTGTVVAGSGPESVRALIKTWRVGLSDFEYKIEDLIAAEDTVVARVTFTGTHTGIFSMGSRTLPPTGKPVHGAEVIIFRIMDGKIVESWAIWDRLSVLGQLDAIPKPTQARH